MAAPGCRYWPEAGLRNPCLAPNLPASLQEHPLIQQAWAGLNPKHLWDSHVHLLGEGDSGSGMWVNPEMRSLRHPLQRLRRSFFLNGACVGDGMPMDGAFLDRLLACQAALGKPVRLLLLAFEYHYDESGRKQPQASAFYVPNKHAAALSHRYPRQLTWAASIHPYRADAIAALETAVRHGAQAVKWLPPAMGMDPASAKCDDFYTALARWGLPLISHAGDERAVRGSDTQHLGNPLRLRRALDHGVRVIVAHCASLGVGHDTDRGPDGPQVPNFLLFARMMEEARYQDLLFGEISAVTQSNRAPVVLDTLLARTEWHPRLVNGSDYPLPGVYPLFAPQRMAERGLLAPGDVPVLSAVRQHNPLLFDFLLKRTLRRGAQGFAPTVFESGRLFSPTRPGRPLPKNTADVW
ncbi:MAG: amidohydrolase [Gammaproteobacteria bacterium]|nr:MAG: amidohydrolase [Gammaproteobacteria bacterium]